MKLHEFKQLIRKEIKRQLNEDNEWKKITKKLALDALKILKSQKFNNRVYLSIGDRDKLKQIHSKLPYGFAKPDKAMDLGLLISAVLGKPVYFDDADLVDEKTSDTIVQADVGRTFGDFFKKIQINV